MFGGLVAKIGKYMDRRIKFRHLEAFVGISRAGSLKQAAMQLNLTQPAISKTLRELEDFLGARLMARDRSGVALTPQGEVFLQFAQQSLAALQHGLTSLASLGTAAAGHVSIGALPSVAAKLLPAAVSHFRALAPGAVIQVEEGPHSHLVERLRSGALDLVVGRLGRPETMTGLSFTQLYSEHVVVVVSPDHPLAGKGRLTDISAYTVLYPPPNAAIRPLVDRMMIAQGIAQFPDRIESASGAFGRAMTLGPIRAVWIISHGVVEADIAAGRLVPLAIETAITAGPVGIMARAEEDPSPTTRLFRHALIEAQNDGS
jgi:LysR family pca operon transcriptional activator